MSAHPARPLIFAMSARRDDDIERREHVMLYDPKWEKQFVREETETERELKSLISWLEKQPARSSYPWVDIGNCLLGRYFTARYGSLRGRQMSAFAGVADKNSPTYTLLMKVAYPVPHTYDAALKRARALIA